MDSTGPDRHSWRMPGQNWKRLGDAVSAKRYDMKYLNTRSFAQGIGLSERTLGRLENGHGVGRNALIAVEHFFGWPPGTANRILAGGDPPEAAEATGKDDPGDLAPLDDVEQKIWDIKQLGDARRTHILFYRASVKHENPFGQTG